ncbi:MAG TPA: hypothetical protein VJ991_12645, partial [Balneolales bacterium]|nr:hypothetical protein [Balneolales bacterium]
LFRSGVHLLLTRGVIQGLWPFLNGHHLEGGAHWARWAPLHAFPEWRPSTFDPWCHSGFVAFC